MLTGSTAILNLGQNTLFLITRTTKTEHLTGTKEVNFIVIQVSRITHTIYDYHKQWNR